jgi:Ca2+-binding RTX toxin-like protein
MATKNINGLQDGSVVVKTSGNIYNIGKNAKVISDGGVSAGDPVGAIMEDPTVMPAVKNNTYNIDGRLIGFSNGMFLIGANDEVNIGATGRVTGQTGIAMGGANSRVVNDGMVASVGVGGSSEPGYAFHGLDGDNMQFRNNGDVHGYAGVVMDHVDKALIVNNVGGEIIGLIAGAAILNDAGATGKLINHGIIAVIPSEMAAAVVGGDGNDTFINDGTIAGHVMLGTGDDVVDNRGGKIEGSIVGSVGDDVLITDKNAVKLSEAASEGDDTVKSSVSYVLSENVENLFLFGNADINGTGTAGADKLHGNNGNNVVKGLAGMDDLWGGKGNDQLTGGLDADIFHFSTGYANDKITDFLQATDKVDVSAWTGVDDLADIKSHATDQGDDVLIKVGTDSLLIKGLNEDDLAMADFIFAV